MASASGGFAGAIVLYETALGVGIAVGPLLGGTLGEISWRGPFYGVTVLMAIALIATVVLVEPTPKPAHPTGLSAPLRALRHRGLLDHVADRALLQLGLLHRAGLRAVPDEPEPDQARPGLHRLGHHGGHLRRVRRPAAAGIPRHRQDHVPQPGRVRRGRAGHRHLDDGPRGADPGRHRVRDLHRGQQHGHHPGRDDRLPGGEAGRLGGLQLRPVHRRRAGSLRGRPDGPRGQHPLPVLHRRRGHRGRHRHPVHRAPAAQRGRTRPGRAGHGDGRGRSGPAPS